MKKRFTIILTAILCMFLSINVLNAKTGAECSTSVKVGESIKCTITIDKQGDEVTISTNDNLKMTIDGDAYSKLSSKSVKFTDNGKVTFGPVSEEESYILPIIINVDGTEKNEEAVVAVEKEITTTTTTTAKKTTTTTSKKEEEKTTSSKKSDNNFLTSITLDGEKLTGFDKEKTKYTYDVDSDVKTVKIKALTEDENATYEVDMPSKLVDGENEVVIKVTAEDGSVKNYKLIINKKEQEETEKTDAETSTKIIDINVRDHEFDFDGSSKTYHLTIPSDVDSVSLDIKLEDETAEYEVRGNENLEEGSVIEIIVTDLLDNSSTYRIIVNKEDEKASIMPFVIGGLVIILIGLIVAYVIYTKKSNTKPTKKEEVKSKLDEEDDETLVMKKEDIKALKEEYNIGNDDNDDIGSDDNTNDDIFEEKIDDSDDIENAKTKIINFEEFKRESKED